MQIWCLHEVYTKKKKKGIETIAMLYISLYFNLFARILDTEKSNNHLMEIHSMNIIYYDNLTENLLHNFFFAIFPKTVISLTTLSLKLQGYCSESQMMDHMVTYFTVMSQAQGIFWKFHQLTCILQRRQICVTRINNTLQSYFLQLC